MTREEYNRWLNDFQTRFPDSANWMRGKERTLAMWFNEIFSRLTLDDCLSANRELMTSDDPIRAYERETIAARVAQIARRIAYRRSDAANQDWRQNTRRRFTPDEGEERLGDILRKSMRAKRGKTKISFSTEKQPSNKKSEHEPHN